MLKALPALVLMMAVAAGCGESSTSVDDLSDALLTTGDLTGEWTEFRGNPEATEGTIAPTGIVTDEQRAMLPTMDLCERASDDAKTAANALRWDVFRQFDKTVADPIDPPTDREGHKVFLQQFMLSDDSDAVNALFDDLASGLEACLGDIPAGEEGPGRATEVEITSVGDEHIAVLTQIEEAGGRGMWYLYNAFVRDGSVLMSVTLADVFLGDLQPEVDLADFDELVTAAVDKL